LTNAEGDRHDPDALTDSSLGTLADIHHTSAPPLPIQHACYVLHHFYKVPDMTKAIDYHDLHAILHAIASMTEQVGVEHNTPVCRLARLGMNAVEQEMGFDSLPT
jgi:hypothetical protein